MFKPMYVTRAVQQAYGIDHPIGDPFGGAAYGEKNGGGSFGKIISSAVPIIAGAAMMIGSGGALAPMVIGGAMMAGGAMSGIGAITGNQTLSKIGGITSAVAGVAAMGYGAYSNWDSISNFFSSGTELAGTTAGAETAAGTMADLPGVSWNTAAAEGATVPGVGEVSGNFIAQSTPAAFDATAVSGGMANAPSVTPSMAAAQSPSTALPMSTTSGANAVSNTQMATGGFGTAQPFSGTPAALPGGAFGGTGGATVGDTGGFVTGMMGDGGGASGGLLSSVGNFIKENPVVSLMGLQTLGGLAEGASPKSQAEGDYIQAMTDMKNAEMAYLEASKAPETAANTEYLLAKAQEFEKTKAYAEEKRRLYNESITSLQNPQTQNLAQTMYGGAQNTGIINAARA